MSVEVSIIVPCYNCQDTIKECYKSIVKSIDNLFSYEVIFINDGSTDNTLNILNEIKGIDKNVNVINQENFGVSAARNNGLKISKGIYVSFVDSDDTVMSEFYPKMLAPFKEEKGLGNIYTEVLKSKGSLVKLRGSACNKIYKKEILDEKNVFFDERIKFCEDLGFNLIYFKYISKISIIPEKLYVYDIHNTDIPGNSDKKITAFKIWDNLLSRENEEKYENVIKLEKYKYMIWGLCEQLSEKGEVQNKEYLELLKKEKDFIIKNKFLLGRKFELLFRLMMISPIFVKCLYRIL